MTTTEQITNVATALGWSVETDASRPGFTEFEFRQYTPAGQDFGFSVEMRNGDPDSLLQELEKYYEATPTMKPICGSARTGTARTAPLTTSKTS